MQEKLRFIAERPKERGDEKSGAFKGFKSLKVDGTSHVLLFTFDEQKQRVIIARYEHHDVAYRTVPSIVETELTALNLYPAEQACALG